MTFFGRLAASLSGFAAGFATPVASAYSPLDPATVIGDAAPTLVSAVASSGGGGTELHEAFFFFAEEAALLITGIAIIVTITAGLRLAFSQSEDAVNVARRAFVGSAAAIILVALARTIREALFSTVASNIVATPGTTAAVLCSEGYGVIELVQIPLMAVAVMMIIIHGIRAVISYGSDEGVANLRRAVVAIAFGVLLIAIREVFTLAVLDSNTCAGGASGSPDPIIQEIIRIINLFLGFIGLIAVVVICIAGIMMIVNLGNDDQYARARSLIVRVILGLIVILVSFGIVNLILSGI